MTKEAPQKAVPEPTHEPPSVSEETDVPPPPPEPESAPQPPPGLAKQDLQKDSPPIAAEEKLKEAFTVIQKDTPLEPSPPESSNAALEKDSAAAPVSPPLAAAALAVPQESESPKSQSKAEPETEKQIEKKKVPESLVSFKEESNKAADLSDYERNALEEFKILVQQAINNRLFTAASPSENTTSPEEVSIWGVPLLKDDRSEVILLKFLRARDFKVKDSFVMLKNTIRWRRDFKVDELLKEDLGDDLEKVVFMHGHDKKRHPVCYNVYGEFQNKELYNKTFADEDKRTMFLRWRIQFLERSIRKLDFNPGGINTIFQVSDLMNSPGPGKRELRIATKQALQILQDNYPEFVAKQVFINVPWWYLAFYTMIGPFLTQRTKSKFVFAGPTKTADTLFKYISAEQVPTQYGGLSVDYCECNPNFTVDDPATEIIVKPATKQIVEIIVNEKCSLVWEVHVVGWEVSYSAEYVPKRGYTVVIEKNRKMSRNDEPVVSNSFDMNELGKILLTVDNPTAKKKKLLYRFKVIPYDAS